MSDIPQPPQMPPVPVRIESVTFTTTADLPVPPRRGHVYKSLDGAPWYVVSVHPYGGIIVGDPPKGKLYRVEFRGSGPRLPAPGEVLAPQRVQWTESLVRVHLPPSIQTTSIEDFVGTPWSLPGSGDPAPYYLLRFQDRQEDGSFAALVGCSKGRTVPVHSYMAFDTQTYFQMRAAADMAGERHG